MFEQGNTIRTITIQNKTTNAWNPMYTDTSLKVHTPLQIRRFSFILLPTSAPPRIQYVLSNANTSDTQFLLAYLLFLASHTYLTACPQRAASCCFCMDTLLINDNHPGNTASLWLSFIYMRVSNNVWILRSVSGAVQVNRSLDFLKYSTVH